MSKKLKGRAQVMDAGWRRNYGETFDKLMMLHPQSCKMSIFYTVYFCPTKFTPIKKRVNRDKFLTSKVFNGHKKQILGQKYQKLYLEGYFEEKCHCSC